MQYLYFDEFIEFRGEDDSDILKYIEEFERKADKLKAVKCVIPDIILAHTLLKNGQCRIIRRSQGNDKSNGR